MRRTAGILLTAAVLGGSTLALTAAPAVAATCDKGYVCLNATGSYSGKQENIPVNYYTTGINYNLTQFWADNTILGSIRNRYAYRVWLKGNQDPSSEGGANLCYPGVVGQAAVGRYVGHPAAQSGLNWIEFSGVDVKC